MCLARHDYSILGRIGQPDELIVGSRQFSGAALKQYVEAVDKDE